MNETSIKRPEEIVVSFDMAKRMRDAGIEIKTKFRHFIIEDGITKNVVKSADFDTAIFKSFPAPVLGEMFSHYLLADIDIEIRRHGSLYEVAAKCARWGVYSPRERLEDSIASIMIQIKKKWNEERKTADTFRRGGESQAEKFGY